MISTFYAQGKIYEQPKAIHDTVEGACKAKMEAFVLDNLNWIKVQI